MATETTPGKVKVSQKTESEAALDALRGAMLELLRTDDALKDAIRLIVLPMLPPLPDEQSPVGSQAEHGQTVIDLIEQKLRLHIRPDAFRRPLG